MVFEQSLRVFPARQSTDSANGSVCHGVETLRRRVSEYGPLRVRSLDIVSSGENLASRVDDSLRDIERMMGLSENPKTTIILFLAAQS